MRARAKVLSLAIVATGGCGGDSTGPSTGPSNELIDVVLNFCSTPVMAAYQNEGSSWTNAQLVNGSATVKAAPKTIVMLVWPPVGSNTNPRVDFLFVSRSELELYAARGRCALAAGSKTLLGEVANVDFEQQRALVVMGDAFKFVFGPFPRFAMTNVPAGPVDLVATRRVNPDTSASNTVSDRVIIRRAVDLPEGSTMPVLDFEASEAVSVASNSVTISGQGGDDLFMENDLITAAGTAAVLEDYNFFSGSVPLISVPSANLANGDIHQLSVIAMGAVGFRGSALHYRAAGNKSLPLGTDLATPSVTLTSTTPYVRLRVRLPSQADYPDLAQFFFSQGEVGGKSVRVSMTKGYFGGTPTIWDVTIPDVSAVAGFQSSWMLENGVSTTWDGEAWFVSLPWFFGGAPADGSIFRFATRSSSINTSGASFRAPRSPSFGLLTPRRQQTGAASRAERSLRSPL